ncbi:ABC transporter ATP-binding protein [Leucobacter tenebrionis]|uniref:ABC transporter ATP-binding protein n=1 Tax=Leucobacter tenebrionis TaxID=2873270 RepID=UPI001CA7986C|nr:ABC transporter ATP-binding protein [Leucobacter tenebrionis]QZY50669.1 ABC transporter ATP-binding protein [Leucobacter tenebrionis]
MTELLQIDDLTLRVPSRGPLLHGVSLSVAAGESVALVGESGSGKSLTTRAALGLFPEHASLTGSVRVAGVDTVTATPVELRAIRRTRASMIFQDPRSGINPVRTLGDFLTETLVRWHGLSRADAAARAVAQLEQVGLPRAEALLEQYPHQLSGGMLQRVMIAAALLDEPELLLCDEPTTALDVTTQAGIVELLREQQQARGMGMLFITHDLGLAASLCERVVVLRGGLVVEEGVTADVFRAPREEYTRELLAATPKIELGRFGDASGAAAAQTGADRIEFSTSALPTAADSVLTPSASSPAPAIRAEGLSKHYRVPGREDVHALSEVGFELAQGGSLGIVGESGSGKSTLARIIVGLEEPSTGALAVDGVVRPQRSLNASERRALAAHTQMVFQDPYLSLDPRIPVGRAVADVVRLHRGASRADAEREACALLERVGIRPEHLASRPRALSGGQRQRVALAKALAAQPSMLVLDEATSALDVSVQAQVLELVEEVREQFGLTIVFVSHDLAVVSRICEETLVMQRGRVVEHGRTAQILGAPREEYTRRLLASRPEPLWQRAA